MKKVIFLCLMILLLACSESGKGNTTDTNTQATGSASPTDMEPGEEKSSTDEPIDIKTLFKLSPLSIFDASTQGLNATEKEALLEKSKSESWEISTETKTSLGFTESLGNDGVKLYYLAYTDKSDGILAVETTNSSRVGVQFWEYSPQDNSFEKSNKLKEIKANDFLSTADKLPDSYQPQLHYQFIDEQRIEVSLYTWMEEEFETREISNRVWLSWNGQEFVKEIVKIEAGTDSPELTLLDKSTHDLSKLTYEGKVVNKRIWEDAKGENIVLFTQKGETELFVYHYAVNDGQEKLLRKIYDFEKDCEFDLFLEFIGNSIQVTDVDKNEIGEITFAYKKACISDVSPKELKLMVLENGDKYILRGTTSIEMPDMNMKGEKNIDASFNNAPASFLSHANKIWDLVETE